MGVVCKSTSTLLSVDGVNIGIPFFQHVASNRYTRYRPFPLPAQFASSPDLMSRMTAWLRRELRVWPSLDVEVREGLILRVC